jgi:hypothetical protein
LTKSRRSKTRIGIRIALSHIRIDTDLARKVKDVAVVGAEVTSTLIAKRLGSGRVIIHKALPTSEHSS